MNDPDEWQTSEAQRRAGPGADGPEPHRPEPNRDYTPHLTQKDTERIEGDVREEVAAHSDISDS
jgi:hypothetical protein